MPLLVIELNNRADISSEKDILPIFSYKPCYHIIGADFNALVNTQGAVEPVLESVIRLGMFAEHPMLIHQLIKGERPRIQDCTVYALISIINRLCDIYRAACFVYTVNCRSFHMLSSLSVSSSIIAYHTQNVNYNAYYSVIYSVFKNIIRILLRKYAIHAQDLRKKCYNGHVSRRRSADSGIAYKMLTAIHINSLL